MYVGNGEALSVFATGVLQWKWSMYFFDLGAEDLFVIEGLHADMASSDSRASLNKK